ncbi:hypothetical protein [Halomonas sp. 3A7M]|uniref:hypothetical protein n=1 Tax=Halomonas sp. 3A7M TaxID=2742616 RepID=UPI001867BF1D|nr:hypothetical protein [Halomonas sp. 3A7M]
MRTKLLGMLLLLALIGVIFGVGTYLAANGTFEQRWVWVGVGMISLVILCATACRSVFSSRRN